MQITHLLTGEVYYAQIPLCGGVDKSFTRYS